MERKKYMQVAVPVELRRLARARAALRGEPLASWVTRALENQLRIEDGVGVAWTVGATTSEFAESADERTS